MIDVTEFFSERGGGVRTHLEAKARMLRERGHGNVVIAPGPAPAGTGEGFVRVGGPPLPYDPTYHLMIRVDRVVRAIREERPDVVEIHSPYLAAAAALLAPASAFGIRTFFWHADFVDTYLKPFARRFMPDRAAELAVEPAWALGRAIASRCDATFVAGRLQLEKLRRRGLRRLYRLPLGVDRSVFHPGAASARGIDGILGRDGRELPVVVAAGRFSVEKRLDVVVDAVRRLRARRPVALVVLGDGPERDALVARAAGLPAFFPGFEKDRAAFAGILASCDLFVHSCPYETFGLSVAEARACGVPVVVPDEGGAGEDVDPSCSETYASRDPEACAAAIDRLLARDRAAVRARAREAAAAVLSIEQHFDAQLELYARLLAERRPRRGGPLAAG